VCKVECNGENSAQYQNEIGVRACVCVCVCLFVYGYCEDGLLISVCIML
jgi:hypothetical protein